MEPLIEIPSERWPELRDTFKSWWPHGVAGYIALDTQIRNPDFRKAFHIQVFCPEGDFNNGVVAFTNKGSLGEVIVMPNNIDTAKLESALESTKLINWDKVYFPFCDTDVMKIVNRLCPKLKLNILDDTTPTIRIFRSCTTPPYENIKCPEGTYTGSLELKHIPQVDEVWPHRYSTSHAFFECLINNGSSFGLFSTNDQSLLAWVFLNEVGFLTHLCTDKKHRGKGYAEFLMKHVSNCCAVKGMDLWAHILENNHKSLNLFRKLEYEVIGRGIWMFVSRTKFSKL